MPARRFSWPGPPRISPRLPSCGVAQIPESRNRHATVQGMIDTNPAITVMNDDDLLACTRELVRKSCTTEAELLVHLAEIDERKLYAERAFPSMHVFCVKELGFSDDAAYNRIGVARAARRWPALLEALASGGVHLAGLRVLVPHLSDENHRSILAEARGKSNREIEEMAARLSPKPPVPDLVRKLPNRPAATLFEAEAPSTAASASIGPAAAIPAVRREQRRPVIAPLSEDTYTVQFTAPRALRDKLQQAKDLLRHRVPGGELAVVLDKALDALLDKLMKERFAVGTRPRKHAAATPAAFRSRHIPAPIRRAVYQRAGGRCEFVDENGRRCAETGRLEYDHVDGFARTHIHSVEAIRLVCGGHNAHAADQLYGRVYMERVRREVVQAQASAPREMAPPSDRVGPRPGASPQRSLFGE